MAIIPLMVTLWKANQLPTENIPTKHTECDKNATEQLYGDNESVSKSWLPGGDGGKKHDPLITLLELASHFFLVAHRPIP